MTDGTEKYGLTRRVLMLMSVNYMPRSDDHTPLSPEYIALTLGEDENLVEEELEFLWQLGILHRTGGEHLLEDKHEDGYEYSLWP
jgi:Holliday junction resolvasome RuvABC ATP-dependent DNA helicase subunit